ncbi:MAG: ABC transporter permease [Ectothiorhodospiraceae bacterium AqS1]|nr:ABC transporter permease [Ectothiorhodospiraceae bacterium AqS1]
MQTTAASPNSLIKISPILLLFGGAFGLLIGNAHGAGLVGMIIGAAVHISLAFVYLHRLKNESLAGWINRLGFAGVGLIFGGIPGGIAGFVGGHLSAWIMHWTYHRRYRDGLLPYLTTKQVLWHYSFRILCALIFIFLIAPILVVMPLSFNAQDFFTFTDEMLRFDPEGYSLRHYMDFLGLRADSNGEWLRSLWNSLIIAPIATLISVSLGTLAAIGLSQSNMPAKRTITAILISPMIVPLIISATGMFFFYSALGNWMEQSIGMNKDLVGYIKVILAHAVLGIPFVIITVTATLVGFDRSLTRAAANMGANPITTFFRIQMPLILPGVISGGLFAFITSFDEVVVVLFIGSASQKTLPWQMFLGLREQISPTILAVATILVVLSIALLTTLEMLRRRSERLRGMSPA